MFERFTDNARRAVKIARGPERRSLDAFRAMDVVIAAARQPRGVAADLVPLLTSDEHPPNVGGEPTALELCEQAVREARSRGENHVGTEHLVLALLRLRGPAAEWLAARGLTLQKFESDLAAATAAWHQQHPPLAYRLGAICRSMGRWLKRGA